MEQKTVKHKGNTPGQAQRRSARPVVGRLVGGILGGALGIGLGFLVGHSGAKAFQSLHPMPFWAILLCLFSVCYLVIALHELGHLLAGVFVGFRPYLYCAGPLRIDWDEQRRWRVRLHRDFSLYGGLCATLPVDTEALPRRFAFFILGGPLMSLVCGVISAVLAVGLPAIRLPSAFFSAVSCAIFLATAIPMPNGAFLTDGARWLQLRRGGPLAARDSAFLYLLAVSMTDIRPSDWPEDIVQAANAIEDGTLFEAAGHYFRYMKDLDRGDLAAAYAQIERVLQISGSRSPGLQASYRAEAAWFYAWHLQDPAVAQTHLDRIGRNPIGVREADLLTARAAIAFRSGNVDEGRSLVSAAIQALSTGQTPTTAFSRARLEEMNAAYPVQTIAGEHTPAVSHTV